VGVAVLLIAARTSISTLDNGSSSSTIMVVVDKKGLSNSDQSSWLVLKHPFTTTCLSSPHVLSKKKEA